MLKMNGGRIGSFATELFALLAEDNFPFDIPELQVRCCSAKSIILIRAQFAKTSRQSFQLPPTKDVCFW